MKKFQVRNRPYSNYQNSQQPPTIVKSHPNREPSGLAPIAPTDEKGQGETPSAPGDIFSYRKRLRLSTMQELFLETQEALLFFRNHRPIKTEIEIAQRLVVATSSNHWLFSSVPKAIEVSNDSAGSVIWVSLGTLETPTIPGVPNHAQQNVIELHAGEFRYYENLQIAIDDGAKNLLSTNGFPDTGFVIRLSWDLNNTDMRMRVFFDEPSVRFQGIQI